MENFNNSCIQLENAKNKEKDNTKVLVELDGSLNKDLPYIHNNSNVKQTGRIVFIKTGSAEEGIIADWMEDNMETRMTAEMANKHRENEGVDSVSQTVIVCNYNKMKPLITNVKKATRRQQ